MARILLVENDRDIRLALCDVLEHEGQYVSTASNGDEALELLGKKPINLIIANIFMPQKDGIELIVELRKAFPATKIIVYSNVLSNVGRICLKAALRLGASCNFTLPVSRSVLLGFVDQYAGNSQRIPAGKGV